MKILGHFSYRSSLVAVLAAALALSVACSDDDDNGVNGGNGTQEGVSVVDAETEADDGSTWSDSGSIDDDDVGADTDASPMPGEGFLFSASTADGILDMVLMTDGGTVINATVETSEDNPAPGTFEVSAPMSGTYLDLVDATTASIYETTNDGGGAITLQTCPQSMGDRARGTFDDIYLEDSLTGATRTLSGSFDIVVAGFAEPLHCEEESTPPTNGQPDNNGQTCGWDGGCVTTDGACCPYAECMSQCQLDCVFEDPDCGGGLDPVACAQCGQECYEDVCGVSDACADAAEDFETCETSANCDQIEDDSEYLSCIQDNCCSEATAAF